MKIDELDIININYKGDNFIETLKKTRIALGCTQEEFSKKLKVKGLKISSSTLRSYEQGKRFPQSPIIFIKGLRETLKDELNEKGIVLKITIE